MDSLLICYFVFVNESLGFDADYESYYKN